MSDAKNGGEKPAKQAKRTKPLLRVLAGETLDQPPWWLMRQAGRYLPEYRALRATAGDFITLCLTPELAAEATLQPIRRFGMDAAILFSDILLVPRALGQHLSFENDGPRLAAISGVAEIGTVDQAMLEPVGDAVRRVRAELPETTALIGFAGAPWTVATYMVEGGGSRDFLRVKTLAYRDPAGFAALIEAIGEATFGFLSLQIEAGVEAVQLFDSWAGILSADGFERWVTAPTKRLVDRLKTRFPQVPVIGFPRGAGLMIDLYAAETGVDAVRARYCDRAVRRADKAAAAFGGAGNLDPILLRVGGDAMHEAVTACCATRSAQAYVFNLRGHGVLPDTPPEHVAELARRAGHGRARLRCRAGRSC